MAKEITGKIKLQCPAGQATPAPPVGPALGSHGVNIAEFVKQFNDRLVFGHGRGQIMGAPGIRKSTPLATACCAAGGAIEFKHCEIF